MFELETIFFIQISKLDNKYKFERNLRVILRRDSLDSKEIGKLAGYKFAKKVILSDRTLF